MTHAIVAITRVPPDGITWTCDCGVTGRCPRPIAADVLADHLAGL